MKFYSITNLFTNETKYFKFLKSLCNHYNFNYQSIINNKSSNGLPIIKDNFIINQAEIND